MRNSDPALFIENVCNEFIFCIRAYTFVYFENKFV